MEYQLCVNLNVSNFSYIIQKLKKSKDTFLKNCKNPLFLWLFSNICLCRFSAFIDPYINTKNQWVVVSWLQFFIAYAPRLLVGHVSMDSLRVSQIYASMLITLWYSIHAFKIFMNRPGTPRIVFVRYQNNNCGSSIIIRKFSTNFLFGHYFFVIILVTEFYIL